MRGVVLMDTAEPTNADAALRALREQWRTADHTTRDAIEQTAAAIEILTKAGLL